MEIESWMVFGKLRYGQWRDWPHAETSVLDAYFEALWSALLARPLDTSKRPLVVHTLGNWLSDLSHAHDDLSRCLKQWEADASDPDGELMAAAHLAQTIVQAREVLPQEGSLGWHIHDRSGAQEAQVNAWITSEKVLQLLEAAFFRWSGSPYATLLSEAHCWVGLWQRRSACR